MKPFNTAETDNIMGWLASVNPLPVDVTKVLHVSALYIHCETESDWLTAREGGLGASEIGVVMGVSKWTSPYALWHLKKLGWRIPQSEAQQWGHLVEDPITALFAQEMNGHLYIAKPYGHPYSLWRHPVAYWAICTPDRLAVRTDGTVVPVEIKSDEGGPGWGEPGTDQIPPQYRFQALWQAFIFGADGTYVVRKRSSGKRRMVWYWVPYQPVDVTAMLTRGWDFLTSIEENTPPDPDGSSATTEALQALNPLETDAQARVDNALYNAWIAARTAKADAIEADRLASNRMRAAMGNAEYATVSTSDGMEFVVAKRRIGKRDGYTVAPTTTDELRKVNSGQHPQDPGVRPTPPMDPPPASADQQEDATASGGPGTRVGEGPTRQDNPRRPALTDDVLAEVTEEALRESGINLPPELAQLVQNAIDGGVSLGIARPAPDRDCDT